jgi:hypothetical protein
MATLNPSNVINGNTIQASDVLQLFEAFGTGSQNITGLSLTGSITNATTAATASASTNLIVATTSSGIYYPVIVDGSGTKPPKILSTFELSGSVLNNITASHAITASYALTGSVTQVNNQFYDNLTTAVPGDFKFVAGKVAMTNGSATSSVFTVLAGKTIGNTVWINAAYPEAFNITSSVNTTLPPGTTNLSILKVNVSSSGQVLISGAPSDTGTVIFTGIYI